MIVWLWRSIRIAGIVMMCLFIMADTATAPAGAVDATTAKPQPKAAPMAGAPDVALSAGASERSLPEPTIVRWVNGSHTRTYPEHIVSAETWSVGVTGRTGDAFPGSGGDFASSPSHEGGSGASFGSIGGVGAGGRHGSGFVSGPVSPDAVRHAVSKRDAPVQVPEPTSLTLAVAGLAVLCLIWKSELIRSWII